MAGSNHQIWVRHLGGIATELVRMAVACDVILREPGVIERILSNDETVCGRQNPQAFRKLRSLVMATYQSLNMAIDRIGPEETKMIRDAIIERTEKLRVLGGTAR